MLICRSASGAVAASRKEKTDMCPSRLHTWERMSSLSSSPESMISILSDFLKSLIAWYGLFRRSSYCHSRYQKERVMSSASLPLLRVASNVAVITSFHFEIRLLIIQITPQPTREHLFGAPKPSPSSSKIPNFSAASKTSRLYRHSSSSFYPPFHADHSSRSSSLDGLTALYARSKPSP